jgi:hypothetical protein
MSSRSENALSPMTVHQKTNFTYALVSMRSSMRFTRPAPIAVMWVITRCSSSMKTSTLCGKNRKTGYDLIFFKILIFICLIKNLLKRTQSYLNKLLPNYIKLLESIKLFINKYIYYYLIIRIIQTKSHYRSGFSVLEESDWVSLVGTSVLLA